MWSLNFQTPPRNPSPRMSLQASELPRRPERVQVRPLLTQLSDKGRKRLIAKNLAETMGPLQRGIILLQSDCDRSLHQVMRKLHELRIGWVWLVLIERGNEWSSRCGVVPHHKCGRHPIRKTVVCSHLRTVILQK